MADTDVRPWCVHRLRYQPARSSTAHHRRRRRNGGTSGERYFVALWSTVELIIPPSYSAGSGFESLAAPSPTPPLTCSVSQRHARGSLAGAASCIPGASIGRGLV